VLPSSQFEAEVGSTFASAGSTQEIPSRISKSLTNFHFAFTFHFDSAHICSNLHRSFSHFAV